MDGGLDYFLLLVDSRASLTDRTDPHRTIPVERGSLWKSFTSNPRQESVSSRASRHITLFSLEQSSVSLTCSRCDVQRLTHVESQLLLAIGSKSQRFRIVLDYDSLAELARAAQIWMDNAKLLASHRAALLSNAGVPQKDDFPVYVSEVKGVQGKLAGFVRYVGYLPGVEGIWFGVQLAPRHNGLGTCNGFYRGTQYFHCAESSALFVPASQICLAAESLENEYDAVERRVDAADLRGKGRESSGTAKNKVKGLEEGKPDLMIGERVVWISDVGPELGTVRWVGVLPDSRILEYTVGVEFDRPVGTGTGKYNNQQLFRTAQNHASLVPVLGLMKAEEFYGSKKDVPPSPFLNIEDPMLDTDVVDRGLENCVISHDDSAGGASSSSSKHSLSTTRGKTTVIISDNPARGNASSNNRFSRTEPSIYDSSEPAEPNYENLEKDKETGRLLNRDTRAFCSSDYGYTQPVQTGRRQLGLDKTRRSSHQFDDAGCNTRASRVNEENLESQSAADHRSITRDSMTTPPTMHRNSRSVDNIFIPSAQNNDAEYESTDLKGTSEQTIIRSSGNNAPANRHHGKTRSIENTNNGLNNNGDRLPSYEDTLKQGEELIAGCLTAGVSKIKELHHRTMNGRGTGGGGSGKGDCGGGDRVSSGSTSVPYKTGRSTFYERLEDNARGNDDGTVTSMASSSTPNGSVTAIKSSASLPPDSRNSLPSAPPPVYSSVMQSKRTTREEHIRNQNFKQPSRDTPESSRTGNKIVSRSGSKAEAKPVIRNESGRSVRNMYDGSPPVRDRPCRPIKNEVNSQKADSQPMRIQNNETMSLNGALRQREVSSLHAESDVSITMQSRDLTSPNNSVFMSPKTSPGRQSRGSERSGGSSGGVSSVYREVCRVDSTDDMKFFMQRIHHLSQNGTLIHVTIRGEELDTNLDVGSVVEFNYGDVIQYGVLRWVGFIRNEVKAELFDKEPFAIIELEEAIDDAGVVYCDGQIGGTRIVDCAAERGVFVPLKIVRLDQRFAECERFVHRKSSQLFGSLECLDVVGRFGPPLFSLENHVGCYKGVQGHHNSCYLDSTLFSMFSFTEAFDDLLNRPREQEDITLYSDIQECLREAIVNPLRKNFYVRADKILRLRTLLDKNSSVQGLMGEEKGMTWNCYSERYPVLKTRHEANVYVIFFMDMLGKTLLPLDKDPMAARKNRDKTHPEEFLKSLLQETLRVKPYIKLNSGQEAYIYQLFMEKDDKVSVPDTQQLLHLSFFQSQVKLAEAPRCLILQMPRFGKDYRLYKRIIPSLYIDITDILLYSHRECAICGSLATNECRDCFRHFGDSLDKIVFCDSCLEKSHRPAKRSSHKPTKLCSTPCASSPQSPRSSVNSGANSDRGLPPPPPPRAGSSLTLKGSGDLGPRLPLRSPEGLKSPSLGPEHEMSPGRLSPCQSNSRVRMELFAVICINTSHYVSFVKTGSTPESEWVFFDSMADRKGEEHGYNIPRVELCDFLPTLLQTDKDTDNHRYEEENTMPEQMRRLLCDAYICMYRACS